MFTIIFFLTASYYLHATSVRMWRKDSYDDTKHVLVCRSVTEMMNHATYFPIAPHIYYKSGNFQFLGYS